MKPRYTFSTLGKDGVLYYPARTLLVDFTPDIKKAVTWDKPEDFDCLMNEYENTQVIEIIGSVSKIYKKSEQKDVK